MTQRVLPSESYDAAMDLIRTQITQLQSIAEMHGTQLMCNADECQHEVEQLGSRVPVEIKKVLLVGIEHFLKTPIKRQLGRVRAVYRTLKEAERLLANSQTIQPTFDQE